MSIYLALIQTHKQRNKETQRKDKTKHDRPSSIFALVERIWRMEQQIYRRHHEKITRGKAGKLG